MNESNSEIQLPDFVLVHPRLPDDPVNKQGEIGVITAAILNTDEFFVGFDDGEVGLYGSDALLVLKEPGDIYDYMHQNALTLSVDDFKDLKNIALLLDHGTEKHRHIAMELVQRNENIQQAAAAGLDELLDLQQSKGPKR